MKFGLAYYGIFRLLQQFIYEFHQFQQQLITKSYYQVHIEGNMTQKEATSVFRQITKLAQAKGPGSFKSAYLLIIDIQYF